MKLLEERILKAGRNLGNGILKVDGFINHQVDPQLMEACGKEFAVRFKNVAATKVLTAEISGIAPALLTALALGLPIVYARKTKPVTMPDQVFLTLAPSHFKGRTIELIVSPEFMTEGDKILIIDDSSQDKTFAEARALESSGDCPFPLTVLFNPVNQGYGGNQKIGFHYAIEKGFDFVALVHGDGQYAPERLPELLRPLLDGDADAVFGSRMMRSREALRGGMPMFSQARPTSGSDRISRPRNQSTVSSWRRDSG